MTQVTSENLASLQKWAKSVSTFAQVFGRKLTEEENHLARQVGVKNVDQIFLVEVEAMPELPEDLKHLASQHVNPENARGLAVGHAVFLLNGQISEKLLRHEFRHVCQVEMLGGADLFLMEYVKQVIEHGYTDAPFEKDARNAEHSRFVANEI